MPRPPFWIDKNKKLEGEVDDVERKFYQRFTGEEELPPAQQFPLMTTEERIEGMFTAPFGPLPLTSKLGGRVLLSPFTKLPTGRPAVETGFKSIFSEEAEASYEQLPWWAKLAAELYMEAPFFAAMPSTTAMRAGLLPRAGAGAFERIPAQIARGALKPAEVLEKAPSKVVKAFAPKPAKYSSKVARRIAGKLARNPETLTEDPFTAKLKSSFEYALRSQQETATLYRAQRGKQAQRLAEIFSEQEGTKTYFRALKSLEGALEKGEFKMPAEFQLSQQEADVLLNKIYAMSRTTLDSFETTNLSKAILKLSGVLRDDAGLPQRLLKSDLEILQAAFPELRPIVQAYKTLGEKAFQGFVEAANLPRSVLASGDMSVTFRQLGMALARRPWRLPGVIRTQLKVIFSPKNYEIVEKSLLENADVNTFIQHGMYWAPRPGKGIQLWAREEQFMSNLAERIPVIGKGIRASERAFQGGANYMRAKIAQEQASMLRKIGAFTDENIAGLAKVTNAATGRGDLPNALKAAGPLINGLFFSPRYVLSRLQVPAQMFSSNPIVRKEAIKTFVSFMGVGTSVLGLAGMAGAKIEMNPLSSDFGKVRVGNTRLDIWTSYSQWVRMLAQLVMNERKITETGERQTINRYETVLRFMQSKHSPLAGLVTDLLVGRTYVGEPMFEGGADTVKRELRNRLTPLFVQDMIEAIAANGVIGGVYAAPAFLGVGAVSYKPKMSRTVADKVRDALGGQRLKPKPKSKKKATSSQRASDLLK